MKVPPYAKIAEDFARALADGRFEAAHSLLTAEQAKLFSPPALKESLESMYSGYAKGPITDVQAITWEEEWPAKEKEDLGWVYVSISGDEFNEAVTVVVTKVGERLLIRNLEWGRP